MASNSKAGAVLSNASLVSNIPHRTFLNQSSEEKDLEGVALLRHIFPDESIEDLRKLHDERLMRAKRRDEKPPNPSQSRSYSSSEHIISPSHENSLINRDGNRVHLPDDFLRLPLNKAVRRYNNQLHKWEYQLVEHLHKRAFSQHQRNAKCVVSEENFYTRVLERDVETGLGITLTESMGFVRIYGQSSTCHETESKILPGDIVVGINGCTLLETILNRQSMLRETVRLLKSSPSPVCVHLQKVSTRMDMKFLSPPSTISLLDTTLDESFQLEQSFELSRSYLEPSVHPLALVLISRGLVKNSGDQVTRALQQFAKRVRQWNFSNSFHIDEKHHLLSPLGRSEDQKLAFTTPSRGSQPATYLTPGSATATDEVSIGGSSYFSATTPKRLHELSSIFIPLYGVRKALSVRILHSFLESGYDTRAIYTIWVCDIESGHEWYAPSRYFSDFKDLRASVVNLRPDIASIDFPTQAWFSFGSTEASESETARETKCQQLEHFLRTLTTLIYTHPLHPAVAEVAIHVQSFLGCDHVGPSELAQDTSSPVGSTHAPKHTEEQIHKLALLKRELQLYAYRIFLLDPVAKVVSQFVDAARANGPSLKDIEIMQAKSRSALKKRANLELQKIQAVVDQLQDLILEGCMHDLQAIAQSDTFDSLRDFISGESGDRLSREAIRTQVEIEVYVPLRGTVSRLLVNAWRHEDMAVSFKVQVSSAS